MAPDPTPNVRPATPGGSVDVARMHDANRAAWDEAAERYDGWFDEAVALIRSGGGNLLPVEVDLIGDGLRLERVAEHPVDWWGRAPRRAARGARPAPALVLDHRHPGRLTPLYSRPIASASSWRTP